MTCSNENYYQAFKVWTQSKLNKKLKLCLREFIEDFEKSTHAYAKNKYPNLDGHTIKDCQNQTYVVLKEQAQSGKKKEKMLGVSFKAYAMGVFKILLAKEYRLKQKAKERVAIYEQNIKLNPQINQQESPEDSILKIEEASIREECAKILKESFEALSQIYQNVLTLKIFDKFSHRDIGLEIYPKAGQEVSASDLKIFEERAKNAFHRAKNQLRNLIQKDTRNQKQKCF